MQAHAAQHGKVLLVGQPPVVGADALHVGGLGGPFRVDRVVPVVQQSVGARVPRHVRAHRALVSVDVRDLRPVGIVGGSEVLGRPAEAADEDGGVFVPVVRHRVA